MLTLSLIGILTFAFNVQLVEADGGSWVWVGNTVTGAYGEAVVGTGTALYIARATQFYRYLPSDNSFVELASPPQPDGSAFKTGTALAWDFDDYIYALCGAATGDSRRWFYRYSISSNAWEALADTPADQGEGDTLTWVGGLYNCLFATIGGEQRATYFMCYDPSTNSWDDAPADPLAGMGDGASLVWAGWDCLYALRGEFFEEEPLYDFWRYNLTSNAWVGVANIPAYPHDGGVGGVGDGGSLLYVGFWLPNQTDYIYALSGNQAYPDGIPDNRTYRYTISTNSWERLADLPFGVGYYVGCRLGYADGNIYAWQGAASTWEGGGDDLARYEFAPSPVSEVPLFKLLGKETAEFEGGVNITMTFSNYGFNATEGVVWLPWEKVYCNVPLEGMPPTGNLSENLLTFDVNGDGDTSDVFQVAFVDNETVTVDGVTAKAMRSPDKTYYDSTGFYDVSEKNSFALGLKNHTLYRTAYFSDMNFGYAGFGLDSFFRYHPSPNMMFIMEQKGTSINGTVKAQITSVEINGTLASPEFNWTTPWLSESNEGEWFTDDIYVYSLGYIQSNATFTVKLTVKGEPGSYILVTILNWGDDNYRYRYIILDAAETPITLKGTVYKTVNFEGSSYPINIETNSTISEKTIFNSTAMEICFNATGYTGYPPLTYFWNVTIPQNLLKGNPWTITIDGKSTLYNLTSNGNYSWLYFTYQYPAGYFETAEISIKGTWVIPEFPSTIVLPLLLLTTLVAMFLVKRKTKPQLP